MTIIADVAQSGEDGGDLLSMLLQAQDEESGRRMTDQQLRDECMTLFLAGHETTANTLAWTWYLLSQHPEAEAKLHEELDRVLDGRLADARRPAPAPIHRERGQRDSAGLPARLDARPRGERAGRARRLSHRQGHDGLHASWVIHRDRRWFDDPEAFAPSDGPMA